MEPSAELLQRREHWHYRGQVRPPFARVPAPGEESVWDYPRPPRIEAVTRRVRVLSPHGEPIADSTGARRVLETAGPPTIYVPPSDVDTARLRQNASRSVCEWKGMAAAFDFVDDGDVVDNAARIENAARINNAARIDNAAWCYPNPFPEFAAIAGWLAFYPAKLECWLDEEKVTPQPGGYYGGWITSGIVGPFKGEPGCEGL